MGKKSIKENKNRYHLAREELGLTRDEAENLLRNLLLRTPGDHICRNNYGAVLLAKNRREALEELRRAWLDSGKAAFIGKNFQECAKRFNIKLPEELFADETTSPPPLDAVTLVEEKK